MEIKKFILSPNRGNRVARHVVFWLIAMVFFEFSYFLPYYWYHGWNPNDPSVLKVQAEIGVSNFYLLAFTNSLIGMGIISLFTYSLIYFLWPRLLAKEKYIKFSLGLTALFLSCIALFSIGFTFLNPFIRQLFHRPPGNWTIYKTLSCSIDLVLFNCPIYGGAALGMRLVKDWWLRQTEGDRLATARADAELQFLKSQVHPHFLFNTLNNIYSFALNGSPVTAELIKKLTGLLKYIIYECEKPVVPIQKELEMISDYIQLEKVRYGAAIHTVMECDGDTTGRTISPLLLIPFVENSFKHGASRVLKGPFVSLRTEVKGDRFIFLLCNSKPASYSPTHSGGIGLTNVKKRLEILYPNRYQLECREEREEYSVRLELHLENVSAKKLPGLKTRSYEVA